MSDKQDLVARGVVVGITVAPEGCYVRLRVTESDAEALAQNGAFGRMLQIRLTGAEVARAPVRGVE